jgi:hypothetical protein
MPIFIGIPPIAQPIKTRRGTADSVSTDLQPEESGAGGDAEFSRVGAVDDISYDAKTIKQEMHNTEK